MESAELTNEPEVENMTTELTTNGQEQTPSRMPADIGDALMQCEPEVIKTEFAGYMQKRNAVREMLLGAMEEGTHYGYPPGCSSRAQNEKQWKPKQSLYKAGADMICDLMKVRVQFDADPEAWRQLGEPIGTFVFKCSLFSRNSGELISEGRGARKVGQNKMQENASIKMAQKSAKVDAVLNAWGLSDLFTQDLEELKREAARPSHNENAPQAEPRQVRVSMDALTKLHSEWSDYNKDTPGAFRVWINKVTGIPEEEAGNTSSWNQELVNKCIQQIRIERGEENV